MSTATLPMGGTIDAGARRTRARYPAWLRHLVSAPLLAKIICADMLLNLLALAVVQATPPELTTEIMFVSLLATLAINATLVSWALLPLRALEATAARVSRGQLSARFEVPFVADRNIARIGVTLNALLDGLTADRRRLRQLASQVISAGDAERAHIARELHDTTAQSLSALDMILTSAIREGDPNIRERLVLMREIASQSLNEVRTLSHNVHPRVLDDLGLVAALEFLARRTREQSRVPVWVSSNEHETVPPEVASVLYRVAQAAVNNAIRHARPGELRLSLEAMDGVVRLEVTDNGVGFDPARVEASRSGMGLFIMRERLALVDGTLAVHSTVGSGTRIVASVPLTHENHGVNNE